VLDLDEQSAWEFFARPILIELPRVFLLNAIVARQMKTLAVVRLERRIGRGLAPIADARGKVPVIEHERIAGRRVLVESQW